METATMVGTTLGRRQMALDGTPHRRTDSAAERASRRISEDSPEPLGGLHESGNGTGIVADDRTDPEPVQGEESEEGARHPA
jgi:hypothetical protein